MKENHTLEMPYYKDQIRISPATTLQHYQEIISDLRSPHRIIYY